MAKKKKKEEVKKNGPQTGFWGGDAVESFVKTKLGAFANSCTFDYIPFYEDIKAGKNQFFRYDIVCRHKDGDLVLHYKINFDSSGKFTPDPIADNLSIVRMKKGL